MSDLANIYDRNGVRVEAGQRVRFRTTKPYHGYHPVVEAEGVVQRVNPSWSQITVEGPETEEDFRVVGTGEYVNRRTTSYTCFAEWDGQRRVLNKVKREGYGPNAVETALWVEVLNIVPAQPSSPVPGDIHEPS